MKSGIEMMSNFDPFMGVVDGPLTGVDEPDCLCGSEKNGTCNQYDEYYKKFLLTEFDSFSGDVNCLDSSIEEFMDCTDNQLENIILDMPISGSSNEFFQWMNDLSADEEQQAQVLAMKLDSGQIDHDYSQASGSVFNKPPAEHDYCNAADYETTTLDMSSPAQNTQMLSPTHSPDYNMPPSPALTTLSMSTVTTIKSPSPAPVKKETKLHKKKKTRRPKRINDDRLKMQNKIAAIKYRQRKKQEQEDIDGQIRQEEEKNKLLKTKVQELEVQIKVIKELVGKYLQETFKK